MSIRRRILVAVAVFFLGILLLGVMEIRSSRIQSRILSDYAGEISYELGEGPSPAIRFPEFGPYDERLGYTRIPSLTERLKGRGFAVVSQARWSDRHLEIVDRGLFPIYREKVATGLLVTDRNGHPVFRARYPDQTFSTFDSVPPVLVRTLLHIENRALLDPDRPYRNPAVEWDRMTRAAVDLGLRRLGSDRAVPGASTLATQIEKFRHASGGVTETPGEKLRQIASASLRVYKEGRTTLEQQRRIVLDYLNSVPLSGIAGYGEVNGIRSGLRAWYGLDSEWVMERLREIDEGAEGTVGPVEGVLDAALPDSSPLADRGRAFRAVLGLTLSQSRPSYYLSTEAGRAVLDRRIDDYLALLARDEIVPPEVAEAAVRADLPVRLRAPVEPPVSFVDRKGANGLRTHLLGLLAEDRLYELDRWDLEVESTLDQPAQLAVTGELRSLADPEYVAAAGLSGPRLVSEADAGRIYYTFVLMEATERGNLVRVQTDNFEGPLDLNQGGLLELGSTAKLRTVVTYLQMVEELHTELAGLGGAAQDSVVELYGDPLTAWADRWLDANPGGALSAMLAAAMERRYSASPNERFFTGGGIHTFSNFDDTYDGSVLSITTAFRQSVNLVFIRLMRDLVRYEELRVPGSSAMALESDSGQEVRQEYLSRFADREGRIFVDRFYGALRPVSGDVGALVDRIIGARTPPPLVLARIYRAVAPDATERDLAAFLGERLTEPLDEAQVREIHRRTEPEGVSWPDLGYLAGAHPLELWVARHLAEYPSATRAEVMEASVDLRQEVYRWLFTTRRRSAQDQRIRTMLELEAFEELSRRWRELGYPFPQLVPSYATSIGSSGDRPTALAELVGIVLNDGIRRPVSRVEELRFAEGTPFETTLRRVPSPGNRVLSPEVARTVRAALTDVVENGTARRAFGALTGADGNPLPIGGKTGTGDNRSVTVDARGNVLASRPISRTSTFAFFLGDRFFGVVTAYVEGEEAGEYRFTSALPTQLLRFLSPMLQELVAGADAAAEADPEAALASRVPALP